VYFFQGNHGWLSDATIGKWQRAYPAGVVVATTTPVFVVVILDVVDSRALESMVVDGPEVHKAGKPRAWLGPGAPQPQQQSVRM